MRPLLSIAVLPLLAFSQATPANAPDPAELLKHIAQAYESLHYYQFEIHESGGSIRIAAILPDSIYIHSVGVDGPLTCAISAGRNRWRVSMSGPPMPARDGRVPADLCDPEFATAEDAFVHRWKRISKWAGDTTIRGEGTVPVGKAKIKCWIVDIQSRTSDDRTELWIDQSRYLVLREIFENRPDHHHVRREWTQASIDVPPDAKLFRPPGSISQPRR